MHNLPPTSSNLVHAHLKYTILNHNTFTMSVTKVLDSITDTHRKEQ